MMDILNKDLVAMSSFDLPENFIFETPGPSIEKPEQTMLDHTA
jgi:hypothetical protein